MKHFILKIKLDAFRRTVEIDARDESEALDKFHDQYGYDWKVISVKEK